MTECIGRICQIDMMPDGDQWKYDVVADSSCGSCELCLSSRNSTAPEYLLPVKAVWFDISGEIAVDRKVAESYTDLYIYLRSKKSGETSELVEVYTQGTKLKQWYLTEEGVLVFRMDGRGSARRRTANMLFSYKDENGILCSFDIPLSSARISLEALGVWKEDSTITFSLQYFREETAKVFAAPTEKITVLIAPPKVEKVDFDGRVFTLHGEFYQGVKIAVQLWENQVLCETGYAATDGKVEFLFSQWDVQAEYALCLRYEQEAGVSYCGERIPIVIDFPLVKSCRFCEELALLEMNAAGHYEVVPEPVRMENGKIWMPKAVQTISVRRINGRARGPELTDYAVESPGFYKVKVGERELYYVGMRPDQLDTKQDIVVILKVEARDLPEYDGEFFRVACNEEKKTMLRIKKDFYQANSKELREDYEKLCLAFSPDDLFLRHIQETVAERMPMGVEDYLFFHYRFTEEGYLDLLPGMCLQEKVFEKIGKISGGVLRYSIVCREDEMVIEPFSKKMRVTASALSGVTDDRQRKILESFSETDGFSAPCLRMAYPGLFEGRSLESVRLYRGNFCLIGAKTQAGLVQATADLSGMESTSEKMYECCRGHSSVIVQICVEVNKVGRWVTVGTLLGDLLAEEGARCLSFYRRAFQKLYFVSDPQKNMPLLMGDCIETDIQTVGDRERVR